jgi:DNA-binding NarL/FixJ family response regulator
VDGWLRGLVQADIGRVERPSGAAATDVGDVGDVAALSLLSGRELEVLAALAGGASNRELAELLFISERTANRHLSNIFTKLGVHNRTAAAGVALRAGLAR